MIGRNCRDCAFLVVVLAALWAGTGCGEVDCALNGDCPPTAREKREDLTLTGLYCIARQDACFVDANAISDPLQRDSRLRYCPSEFYNCMYLYSGLFSSSSD